jgi:mRNA-degrading endonuclease RelE of RelBE toxin-antitoxin system
MIRPVEFTGKAKKQADKLPARVRELLFQLALEIGAAGPVRGDWPNFQSCPMTGTIAT